MSRSDPVVQTLKRPFDYDFYSHSIRMLNIYIFVLCLYCIRTFSSFPRPLPPHAYIWTRTNLPSSDQEEVNSCKDLFYLEILWVSFSRFILLAPFLKFQLKSIFRSDVRPNMLFITKYSSQQDTRRGRRPLDRRGAI